MVLNPCDGLRRAPSLRPTSRARWSSARRRSTSSRRESFGSASTSRSSRRMISVVTCGPSKRDSRARLDDARCSVRRFQHLQALERRIVSRCSSMTRTFAGGRLPLLGTTETSGPSPDKPWSRGTRRRSRDGQSSSRACRRDRPHVDDASFRVCQIVQRSRAVRMKSNTLLSEGHPLQSGVLKLLEPPWNARYGDITPRSFKRFGHVLVAGNVKRPPRARDVIHCSREREPRRCGPIPSPHR